MVMRFSLDFVTFLELSLLLNYYSSLTISVFSVNTMIGQGGLWGSKC